MRKKKKSALDNLPSLLLIISIIFISNANALEVLSDIEHIDLSNCKIVRDIEPKAQITFQQKRFQRDLQQITVQDITASIYSDLCKHISASPIRYLFTNENPDDEARKPIIFGFIDGNATLDRGKAFAFPTFSKHVLKIEQE